jgi:hypothetical protein
MKTGAESVFAARCPDATRARPNAAMLASITARCSSRENRWMRGSRTCHSIQCAKARACSFWPDQNFAKS